MILNQSHRQPAHCCWINQLHHAVQGGNKPTDTCSAGVQVGQAVPCGGSWGPDCCAGGHRPALCGALHRRPGSLGRARLVHGPPQPSPSRPITRAGGASAAALAQQPPVRQRWAALLSGQRRAGGPSWAGPARQQAQQHVWGRRLRLWLAPKRQALQPSIARCVCNQASSKCRGWLSSMLQMQHDHPGGAAGQTGGTQLSGPFLSRSHGLTKMWCRVERGVVTIDVSQTLAHLHGEH